MNSPTPPPVFPAQTVPLYACGHVPGDRHDGSCDYWRGVAAGEYPAPGATIDDLLESIRQPLVQPAPLTDPALENGATE